MFDEVSVQKASAIWLARMKDADTDADADVFTPSTPLQALAVGTLDVVAQETRRKRPSESSLNVCLEIGKTKRTNKKLRDEATRGSHYPTRVPPTSNFTTPLSRA